MREQPNDSWSRFAAPMSAPRAAASHSCSVGSRLPAQRAKASASCHDTCTTGSPGSTGSRRPIAVRTHQPSPSGSQYIGGGGPGSVGETADSPFADGGPVVAEGGGANAGGGGPRLRGETGGPAPAAP